MMMINSPRVVWTVVLILLLKHSACASGDSVSVAKASMFTPQFRSIQVDYATVVLKSALSLSADLDLMTLAQTTPNSRCAVGLRAGVERISSHTLDGEVMGSPFMDLNLYGRMTTAGSGFRIDTYAGYSYRKMSREHPFLDPFLPPDRGALKIGFDAKWMVAEPYFGLMLKLNILPTIHDQEISGGLGVVLAWE